MNLTREKQGELYILLEAVLWGLFPVITVLIQKNILSLSALGWSTAFSCIFFAIRITVKKKWYELKNKKAIVDILLATIILGVLFYILFFFGLKYTSPGNAGIIELTQIFFSFLFFHVWRKESVMKAHIFGALLVVLGVSIIFYRTIHSPQWGDLLILLSQVIAPFGNFFQRRARLYVSSETILFIRSMISSVVIFFLAYLFHSVASFSKVKTVLFLLMINGVFLLGYSKILWVEGIHRISVMKANAMSGIAPLLTLFYAWALLHTTPTIYQILAFVPIFIGVIFLSRKKTNTHEVVID